MTTAARIHAALLALATSLTASAPAFAQAPAASAPAKPALTVSVVSPAMASLPVQLQANGNIAAWQEALVGAEATGLRLATVAADVGQRVKRGQVLATLADETVRADLAQAQAALAEAEATLAEAAANAERAATLQDSGALSASQIQQYATAAVTARARVAAQRAAVQSQQLRLKQTEVRAPDDGIVSARSATVGAVVGSGQELFRLIRGGRLEWRAELPSADLARVRAGQAATLTTPSGRTVAGTVRQVAPTVDPATRNGLVFVDLRPGPDSDARPGMFARGSFAFDAKPALTLPAAAVLLRDGFSVVMRVGADNRVQQTKVQVLQRDADRVALLGLPTDVRVVARGAAFLSDGDTVRVVADAPAAASLTPAPARPASR